MTYRGFEDLEVWRRSKEFTIELFKALKNCRDYALKDQMLRAAISIASNIAEGFERKSEKDFIRFLSFSKGSAAELKTQLIIAEQFNALNQQKAKQLTQEVHEISAMLEGLIKSIKKNLNS